MDQAPTADTTARPAAPVSSPAPSAAASAPVRSGRKPFMILGAIAFVVAVGIGVYLKLTAGLQITDDAQVTADMVPTAARVSGQVLKVHVADNQQVKKGDLLIELDPADYAARLQQAEAELRTAKAQHAAADAQVAIVEASSKGGLVSAKAQVVGSSSGVSAAHAQVEAARAGLARAEADARTADLEYQRAKELQAQSAIPQAQLDLAQSAYDAAHAALDQAKAQITAAQEAERVARSRVGEAQGRLDQTSQVDAQITAARANADIAAARVDSAQAQVDLAKLQLSYTKIVAPNDGVASRLSVHEGQLIQPGQPLLQLVPLTTYVIANFKETEVGQMRPGQRAEIKLDAFPGVELTGVVQSLSGGTGSTFSLLPPDNASGNFVKVVQRVPVRIEWVNPPADLPLRAGLSAEVTVRVQ